MELIFEWDKRKATANLRKHQVSFDEACTVFEDVNLLTFKDEVHTENEMRFISIGTSFKLRILLIIHTERSDEEQLIIRLISCRKATKAERRAYEKGK
jgi:uncharacterized protein